MAVRLRSVSSVCFALLTLAAANVAGAGGVERAAQATYLDAVGDAGDAPDIARVTIRPEGNRSDLRTRSFNFAVASLRQQADLAPGGGVARYPRRSLAG
jgi:hypothetical protein